MQKDPTKDFITRDMLPSADLLAVYMAKTRNGQLRICAQVRADTRPVFIYALQLKIVGSDTLTQHTATSDDVHSGQHRLEVVGKYFCDSINPTDLGDPWILPVSADVKEPFTGILDQAAWQPVKVQP